MSSSHRHLSLWKSTCNLAVVHPIKALTLSFIIWKFLLLVIIVCSPGPGYDTSTTLLSSEWSDDLDLSSSLLRFVRWDSIYFVRIAERGYLFEQEWAFGYGYTLSLLSSGLNWAVPGGDGYVSSVAAVGVGVSHLCHLLSVLVLYALTNNVFGSRKIGDGAFSFVSAALHIICPAGAFLSAPYGESIFSFLNFAGIYVYSSALLDDRRRNIIQRNAKLVAAGVLFATGTSPRSNGVLSGTLFAYDAILISFRVVTSGLTLNRLSHLISIVTGGSLIVLAVVWPQYLAYTLYCGSDVTPRPWCGKMIPSIYGWVQSYYWNVGFLRYWTVSNIPLFCLAIPMLVILSLSSLWALAGKKPNSASKGKKSKNIEESERHDHRQACLTRLAIPQGLLAVMAFTVYHVQIITRMSSGYPLWYWYIASLIFSSSPAGGPPAKGIVQPKVLVQGMVLYGLIQGALFASFLPPA